MRGAVLLVVAALGIGLPARAQDPPGAPTADSCSPRAAPIPPPPTVPDDSPPAAPYAPLRGLDTAHPLGVGHLNAEGDADWIRLVELPVYPEPGARPLGWIAGGWWIASGDPAGAAPLTMETMVETGYEVASWIVEEARDDGWVRFRFAPGANGSGWTSTCHLSASDPAIVFESWESRFAGEVAGPLFFRTRNRHALRRGPGAEYPRSFWLAGYEATELHPLEIRGDWMRVRVSSPPMYCADPPPSRGILEEGWIRWRDEEMGPWVWWFTRGC